MPRLHNLITNVERADPAKLVPNLLGMLYRVRDSVRARPMGSPGVLTFYYSSSAGSPSLVPPANPTSLAAPESLHLGSSAPTATPALLIGSATPDDVSTAAAAATSSVPAEPEPLFL